MRVRRILSAAGTAIAALTLASSLSGTAYAADVYYIRTTGAEGFYWYDDGYTDACDTLADGRRAVIRVRDVTTGGTLGQVADTDGANGLCGHKYLPVPPAVTALPSTSGGRMVQQAPTRTTTASRSSSPDGPVFPVRSASRVPGRPPPIGDGQKQMRR